MMYALYLWEPPARDSQYAELFPLIESLPNFLVEQAVNSHIACQRTMNLYRKPVPREPDSLPHSFIIFVVYDKAESVIEVRISRLKNCCIGVAS